MEWLRSSRVPEGTQFSTIADKLVSVLTVGAEASTGARKADLLAHLGWAYFLKQRDGAETLRPDAEYKASCCSGRKEPVRKRFLGTLDLVESRSLDMTRTNGLRPR